MSRKLPLLALAAGLCFAWATPVRADRLDTRLNEEMPRVVKQLKDRGYKNVGVLRFRAQRGDGKLGFSVGPINSSMVERVENLLIIHTGSEKGPTIGITHDAPGAALKAGVGPWFTSEAERKKLFEVSYPLAWGDEKVPVDAFLTGKLVNSGDRKKTTVTLEAVTSGNLKPEPLAEFSLETDPSLVRDFGYNYALSREQQKQAVESQKEMKEQVVEDLVITQAVEGEKKQPKPAPDEKPGQRGLIAPEDIAGIKFEMTVEGKPVAIPEANAGDAKYQVPCPAKGQKIVFYLTNNTEKRLGVVLKVGGLNTIDQQLDDSLNCRKWVIAPGKRYTIRGYYFGEKADKVTPFEVLDGEAAKKIVDQVAGRAQFIQVDVVQESETRQTKLISARGMKPSSRTVARRSHETLYRQLMSSVGLVRSRGAGGDTIIGPAPSDPKDTAASEVADFPGPVLIGSLSVRVVPTDATATGINPDENPRD